MAARRLVVFAVCAAAALACRGLYYGAMEQIGREKRHLLADRVEDARDEQQAAREQFRDTLQAFQAVTGFDGGDLETGYRDLRAEYERSERRAEAVHERIRSVEQVAEDLLAEWESELGEMRDPELRRGSEARLRETRTRYGELIAAMRRAAAAMDPVRVAFRDRVLYLKHNLNARAVASLEGDLGEIEADVERLVRDMTASIAEAEAFLQTIRD